MKRDFFVVLVASEKKSRFVSLSKGHKQRNWSKYDRVTQNEVVMHYLKAQIENKTKSGYIL